MYISDILGLTKLWGYLFFFVEFFKQRRKSRLKSKRICDFHEIKDKETHASKRSVKGKNFIFLSICGWITRAKAGWKVHSSLSFLRIDVLRLLVMTFLATYFFLKNKSQICLLFSEISFKVVDGLYTDSSAPCVKASCSWWTSDICSAYSSISTTKSEGYAIGYSPVQKSVNCSFLENSVIY